MLNVAAMVNAMQVEHDPREPGDLLNVTPEIHRNGCVAIIDNPVITERHPFNSMHQIYEQKLIYIPTKGVCFLFHLGLANPVGKYLSFSTLEECPLLSSTWEVPIRYYPSRPVWRDLLRCRLLPSC